MIGGERECLEKIIKLILEILRDSEFNQSLNSLIQFLFQFILMSP